MNLTAVKSFLRSVLDDLVEKRLWPVAAGLVAALVAVPLLLGGSSTSPSTPLTPAANGAASAPADSQALVSLSQSDTTAPAAPKDRPGRVRNPFTQLHQPKAVSTTPASPAPSTGPRPSTGGGSTPVPSPTPVTTPVPAPKKPASDNKPDPLDIYRVSLTFGTPGQLKQLDNIARLSPLPSLDSPFFVFLGVKSDGATAVFMVDSDATPTGDGKCLPDTTLCEVIELKAGETEFFDMANPDGTVTQYTMHVRKITRTKALTQAAAARAHKRKSLAGAAVVSTSRGSARKSLRYSFHLGVLLPVKHRRVAHRASVAGGAVLTQVAQAVAALPVAPAPTPAP
jgi:hypothetical protein